MGQLRDAVAYELIRIGAWKIAVIAAMAVALVVIPGMQVGAQQVPPETTPAAQQQEPYQIVVPSVDTPSWLEPLGPLATLPVWATAAVLAAMGALVVITVVAGARWIWVLRSTRESEK